MKHVLEHGARPASIYSFAQDLGIKESVVYDHFGSFEAIEKQIFKAFFDNTKTLLEKDKEFQSFDAQNKLLSFYFTFFEVLILPLVDIERDMSVSSVVVIKRPQKTEQPACPRVCCIMVWGFEATVMCGPDSMEGRWCL